MDHEAQWRWSTPRFTNAGHPLRRFISIELEMFLQSLQRLQRGDLGLPLCLGLENSQQSAAGCRKPLGLFRHHFAVVNLHFQRKIAHAKNITFLAMVANYISEPTRRLSFTWGSAKEYVQAQSFPRK